MANIYPEYSITREKEFDEAAIRLADTYQRLDQLDQAIDWAMSRNPTIFTRLQDGFYIWRTAKLLSSFPSVLIFYHVDESAKLVNLIRIQEIKDEDGDGE